MMQVLGKVKWYNQYKGYGFVSIEGIDEDVFLHFSVLEQSKIKSLGKDDVIQCSIQKLDKGYQIMRVDNIVSSKKYEVGRSEPTQEIAVVKWFNPLKGFGFAQLSTGEDVFIHVSLLNRLNLHDLPPNTRVRLIVRSTNLGLEALDLEVLPNEV